MTFVWWLSMTIRILSMITIITIMITIMIVISSMSIQWPPYTSTSPPPKI